MAVLLQDMMQAWENCLKFNPKGDEFHLVGLKIKNT